MDLVQVDRIELQAVQARLRLAQDRVPLEAVLHATAGSLSSEHFVNT